MKTLPWFAASTPVYSVGRSKWFCFSLVDWATPLPEHAAHCLTADSSAGFALPASTAPPHLRRSAGTHPCRHGRPLPQKRRNRSCHCSPMVTIYPLWFHKVAESMSEQFYLWFHCDNKTWRSPPRFNLHIYMARQPPTLSIPGFSEHICFFPIHFIYLSPTAISSWVLFENNYLLGELFHSLAIFQLFIFWPFPNSSCLL